MKRQLKNGKQTIIVRLDKARHRENDTKGFAQKEYEEMNPKHNTMPSNEEEVTIALPATALEAAGIPVGTQLSSGHSVSEIGNSFMAAAVGRGERFPCFKKLTASERLIIKITREHAAPGAA